MDAIASDVSTVGLLMVLDHQPPSSTIRFCNINSILTNLKRQNFVIFFRNLPPSPTEVVYFEVDNSRDLIMVLLMMLLMMLVMLMLMVLVMLMLVSFCNFSKKSGGVDPSQGRQQSHVALSQPSTLPSSSSSPSTSPSSSSPSISSSYPSKT